MRIIIPDDSDPCYRGHALLERLAGFGDVSVYGGPAVLPDELIERLSGANVVLNARRDTCFDSRVLNSLPELRLISVRGYDTRDHIDIAEATAQGVVITNMPGSSSTSVAEMGIALFLAAAKHVISADRGMRQGLWPRKLGMEVQGKTLGILGLGKVGLEMARLGRGLGMRVVAWSPSFDPERARTAGVELLERDDLLRQADAVCMCLRIFQETTGAIGRRELAMMKPTCILINVARAALVDEEALVEALRDRRIAAAGLDVYAQEPLPPDHPLLSLGNVVLSPHSAWYTREEMSRLLSVPVDNIIAYLQGKPQHVVNPESLNHPRQRATVGAKN